MRKLAILAGFVLLVATLPAAALTWQTTPVLGTSTYYDGNVMVVTDAGLVNIPHDVMGGGTPTGMTAFNVGQTIDAGSGILVDIGQSYHWSVLYDGPTRDVLYEDSYTAPAPEGGFVMNYLDPVSTLTSADIGNWRYTETWTNNANPSDTISFARGFTVAPVPEPLTMIGAFLGISSLAGYIRKRTKKTTAV